MIGTTNAKELFDIIAILYLLGIIKSHIYCGAVLMVCFECQNKKSMQLCFECAGDQISWKYVHSITNYT